MKYTDNQLLKATDATTVRDVYNQYGSMLYGYLLRVLKDKDEAGNYLITIFDEIAKGANDRGECGPYTWCGLYRIARNKLMLHVNDEGSSTDHEIMVYTLGNNMYADMSDEQKQVFYETYYRGKLVSQLAGQLNKSEEAIKKLLNEAFTILRSGGN